MIKLLVLCFLAAASAAPHFHRRHSPFDEFNDFDVHPSFGEDVFDTRRFWQAMESQIRQMDQMLSNFHKHFPNTVSTASVVGNEYKVVIPLAGFSSKDIKVKAREGVLMVQAVRKTGDVGEISYIDVRSLPADVDASGVWMYENDVLTVVFPIKRAIATENPATEGYDYATRGYESREEMESTNDNNAQDADVSVKKDSSKESAIETNEINRKIEATTYAIDPKNDVEFIPMPYK